MRAEISPRAVLSAGESSACAVQVAVAARSGAGKRRKARKKKAVQARAGGRVSLAMLCGS